MSKLHIVIPIINNLEMTQQAINSVKTKYTFAVHIIDQDSDQRTQDWYNMRQNSKDFWVHRYSPKVSLSEAWNRGVKESLSDPDCDYMFVINNDVLFHEQTIDNLIDALNETSYAMVTCNNVAPHVPGIDEFYKMQIPDDFDYTKPITDWREEGPDFSSFLINRKTIEDIGWFDENFYPCFWEDCEYHARILRLGGHAKRIARAPFYHYGSITAKSAGVSSGPTHQKYIEKWGCADHGCTMDGAGHQFPYNDQTHSKKYWRGVEKYWELEKQLFGEIRSY